MARATLRNALPGLPKALTDWLDPARGALLPPLDVPAKSADEQTAHGATLAATHEARTSHADLGAPIVLRLRHNAQVLREAVRLLEGQRVAVSSASPAAQWLADNIALVEEQLEQATDALPASYFRHLPVLIGGVSRGSPRIHDVALAWLPSVQHAFDPSLLDDFFDGYLSVVEPTWGEWWALPSVMRMVLIEQLRRVGERVAADRAARSLANAVAVLEAPVPPTHLSAALTALRARGAAPAFLLQLHLRWGDLPTSHPNRMWLAQELTDPSAARHLQQSAEAAHDADVSQAMRSLRAVARFDWRSWIERRSLLARTLSSLPTFAAESESTQNQTLHAVERWSQSSGSDESRVARALVGLTTPSNTVDATTASVVATSTTGYWLEGPGRTELAHALNIAVPPGIGHSALWRKARLPVYLSGLLITTLALAASVVPKAASLGWWLLAMLPASQVAVAAVHRMIAEWTSPRTLPRMAMNAGIDEAHRVFVTVPCLLDKPSSVDLLASRLERHHLASHEPWAQYGLLSDHVDAPLQTMPQDAALLRHAESALHDLNRRHAALPDGALRFVLLHRERQWSDGEQCWMGHERKRGKLEQLVSLLAGHAEPSFVDLQGLSRPAVPIPYLVVLDTDTQLPPGSLRALVGIAAHPANMPRLHPTQRRVANGYGVVQPRVAVPLPATGTQTGYQALFAGQTGLDPYNGASSEVYQDLFGEGSFAGKGLIHVPIAHAVLAGRLPIGQVLSHDLLEGALLRCAAASEVPVLEGAPGHPDAASARLHRWTRGDWQLLPFLASPRRWTLTGLNVWKMVDNLRRSLVAPASVALLVAAAWPGTPGFGGVMLLVLTALGVGPVIGALAALSSADDHTALRPLLHSAGGALLRAVLGTLWQLVQLLQAALLSMDAIVRALVRQWVTRHRLLDWTTAAAAEASTAHNLLGVWRRHRWVSIVALLLAAGPLLTHALSSQLAPWLGPAPAAPAPSLQVLLLCALWALSPLLTWHGSQRLATIRERPLAPEVVDDLRDMARETWRYFDHVVTAEHHHLPPDNHQRLPHPQTAARTSPTNIGMYLLAVLCARRLGFIGREDMLRRLQATLGTLDTLPRFRGHFYNWYDTQTLAVLAPGYVSTVDSGNLSAALVAVSGALRSLDDARCQREAHGCLAQGSTRIDTARKSGLLAGLVAGSTAAPGDEGPPPPGAILRDAHAVRQRIADLDDDTSIDGGPPTADERALWQLLDHLRTMTSLAHDCASISDPSTPLNMADHAERLAWEPDYAWLYDPRRELLHIGALSEGEQLDANHYDMLCSEARLASLIAIAKGDVPARHWARLKRPTFAQGASVGVQSWSGSMFEYLMPTLLVDEPAGSLLHAASHVAVDMQRAQGLSWHLPWGISECANAERDVSLAYQYGPQGVASLALRRTPADERVIAPYACMLALQVSPRKAWRNLRRLQHRGGRDRYGFIDALDHTPSRQLSGTTARRVVTFMAHHQGMSLLALTNILQDNVARGWFMNHPQVAAVSSLLQEPVPASVKPLRPPAGPVDSLAEADGDTAPMLPARSMQPGTRALEPVALLTNGRLSVMLRPDGAGATRWMGLAVSRWRDDALRGDHGTFFYLRLSAPAGGAARWHSLTQHPAPDVHAEYRTEWQPHAASFDCDGRRVATRMRVWVAPEEDVEVREITLEHRGDGPPSTVELASYLEMSLATQAADEGHPAFSNLFVQSRWDPALRALWFTRRGRLEGDARVHAVHFLASSEGTVLETRPTSDRGFVLGRGRSLQSPVFEPQADAGDNGLDPVASIALRCVLPRHGTVKLRFATAVSHDPAVLAQIIERHRQRVHVERAWRMATALALIALRESRVDAQAWHASQLLTAPMAQWLARPTTGMQAMDRRCLWRLGLSGERALLLVRVPDADGLPLAEWVARITPLWARAGLAVDVVLLDTEPASYLRPVHLGLAKLIHSHGESAMQPAHSACRLLLVHVQDLAPLELATLQAIARLDLLADGRTPGAVMQDLRRRLGTERDQRLAHPRQELSWLARPDKPEVVDLPRLDPVSGACTFKVSALQRPQRAWANVLANAEFGTHVTEGGGGHCWAHNSRLLQITPPSNDPLADPAAEWLLLQDIDSGQLWSPWPAPLGASDAVYTVVHGPGWTSVEHVENGIEVSLLVCVDRDRRIKQSRLRLRSAAGARRVRVLAVAAWQLGSRWADRCSVATTTHWCAPVPGNPAGGTASGMTSDATVSRSALALLATQTDAGTGFAESTAFLALRPSEARPGWAYDWTCDRHELFDGRGRGTVPDSLNQRSGSGLDPCAALSLDLDLMPGAEQEVSFLLGHADSLQAARDLADTACAVRPGQRAAQAIGAWRERLDAVQVRTPDPSFDVLVNHWLGYQALACRLWARAGFYQIGGAYGFRDQLQDAMALTPYDPSLLRQQILLCASRQFVEGDVQHWWHPPTGSGVRTKFSDDLLWLAAALLRHLDTGGDTALLDAVAPWLEGAPVPAGAEDLYETPQATTQGDSIFEHAARALDRSLLVGSHGLPLMGGGDWNDGMNRVGIEGRGESVWLAWFLIALLAPMADLATDRAEPARALRWRAARVALLRAVDASAWDGAWYRRAFFDDGSALGSAANTECRIDLMAQVWAVLAGGADPHRAHQALQSAAQQLFDGEAGLLRLLDPPLADQQPSAGYIQAYPAGVRENGGQYTHATAWAAMAFAQAGDNARAWQAWQDASPAHRMLNAAHFATYRAEPYAVAGDVYGHAPWRGRAGWSWYTGAAGWLLRAGVESILGMQRHGSRVRFLPVLPPHWPSARVVLRFNGHEHAFDLLRDPNRGDAGARTLAIGSWLDLDSLTSTSRWTVPVVEKEPAISSVLAV